MPTKLSHVRRRARRLACAGCQHELGTHTLSAEFKDAMSSCMSITHACRSLAKHGTDLEMHNYVKLEERSCLQLLQAVTHAATSIFILRMRVSRSVHHMLCRNLPGLRNGQQPGPTSKFMKATPRMDGESFCPRQEGEKSNPQALSFVCYWGARQVL